MAKFNRPTTRAAATSPVRAETVPSGRTHEGGPGYSRDEKSELFVLAVSNMVGEDTFYESAKRRDDRYTRLVQNVALDDIDWLTRLTRWLRGEANMRSAAIVTAAEAVKARLDVGLAGGNRSIVDAALARADEPGELLAYWMGTHGRAVPKPVKRGIADAVKRLYHERSLLKYDTDSHGYRFGDVIDLVHPTARDDRQGDLFKHALDRRHHRDEPIPEALTVLRAREALMALPVAERRQRLADPQALAAAGITWEALAGWLQGPMDREAWEAVIPSMGYMARLRNLRNFDQVGVSDEVAATVAAQLADPAEVARSRQLPMRFLSAYRAAPSLRWGHALEQALGHCLANVPALSGRTLVLIDTSGSMHSGFSRDGTLMRWDAATIFGLALAQRCAGADVVSFSAAGTWHKQTFAASKVFPLRAGESLLRSLDRWQQDGYFIGGGTDTGGALRRHYKTHDRVVIVTDEQSATGVNDAIPKAVPMYTWNLAGYQRGHAPSGKGNRHTFGGLSDAAFRMIPLLDRGHTATWPF